MESAQKENIFVLWFLWHFYEMPKFLLGVWKNYILFALNYFSLPVLLKSLVAPWRKYKWNYPRGFDVGEFFTTLISNMFSRFLGAIMRIVLIAVGVVFQIFVIFSGLVIFLLWLLVPFIIIAGFIFTFSNVI
ncbi:MAG: hypothetical protein NT155_02620 [Candidatus Staskawiczbacteria bacterium]|nr:hypothetical protein [Candidatus Staskawiczbacteria bacterium]